MKPSIRIALFYILIGGGWVAFSSLYLEVFMNWVGVGNSTKMEVVKAIGFVMVSGLIIYLMVERSFRLEKKIRLQYVMIFQNSPICMWAIRKEDLTIIAGNKVAARQFNFDQEKEGGFPFKELFLKAENLPVTGSGNRELVRNQIMVDKLGRERVMDVYAVPFMYGGEDCMMTMVVDNTDVQHMLSEKDELNQKLKDQNEKLKEFSFINSHHIRSPLSNILGIIGLMNEHEKPSQETMRMLKQSAENLDVEIRKMNEILSDYNAMPEMQDQRKEKSIKTILFVDDDKVQHMINKRILLGVDPELDLHFYDNPVDALEWLRKNSADVLLLDINMPEMNGWELLDRIMEEGIDPDVKMLSSSIDPADEVKSKQYSMVSGFLIKPLNRETLVSELKL